MVGHGGRGYIIEIFMKHLKGVPRTCTSISVLEVTAAQVFYFRAAVTSSAEMEVKKTPPTKLLDLDKTIWNPHPEIELASRAVGGES